MERFIGITARMAYRAFVVASMIFYLDRTAIWGLPLGLIIGVCSEAENIVKK